MTTSLNYPTDLRSPLTERVKSQTAKVRTTEPLSGPSYNQRLSTDAPAIYQFRFLFTSPNEALLFRAWVEANEVDKCAPFNIPLNTEFSFGSGGNTTQEVRLIPDEQDILSNTSNSIGVFRYAGTFLCRKELTGLEDDYERIAEASLRQLEGRAQLDITVNITASGG
jgi:hypothetical protein